MKVNFSFLFASAVVLTSSISFAQSTTCNDSPQNAACRLALRIACRIDSNGAISQEMLADGNHARFHSGVQVVRADSKLTNKATLKASDSSCTFARLNTDSKLKGDYELMKRRTSSVSKNNMNYAFFNLDGTSNGNDDKHTWVCNVGAKEDNLYFIGIDYEGIGDKRVGFKYDFNPNSDNVAIDSLTSVVPNKFFAFNKPQLPLQLAPTVTISNSNDKPSGNYYNLDKNDPNKYLLKDEYKEIMKSNQASPIYGPQVDCLQTLVGRVSFDVKTLKDPNDF